MNIGEIHELTVQRIKPHGAYLAFAEDSNPEEDILLPRKELTDAMKPGSKVNVFIYRDSEDRLIATTKKPYILPGEIQNLTVKDTTKIGAFLDWGLEKDLFLPFAEQIGKPKKGEKVLVRLYTDKSNRLCASQKVSAALEKVSDYQKNDWVKGRIIGRHPKIGAFIAVDDRYEALLPAKNIYRALEPGAEMEFRVQQIQEDGRMLLSLKEQTAVAMDADAEIILEELKNNKGFLPFNDQSDPKAIQEVFAMSKSSFKRAVGRLLKQEKIRFSKGGIALNHKGGQDGRKQNRSRGRR